MLLLMESKILEGKFLGLPLLCQKPAIILVQCTYMYMYTYSLQPPLTGALNEEKRKAEKVYFEKVVEEGKSVTPSRDT